ncbi:MAG: conserved membrane protein of unknown function [Nitrospira sp.]|nr:MAG: conserved membrane protein of unknown function [Nitrospira sp.]
MTEISRHLSLCIVLLLGAFPAVGGATDLSSASTAQQSGQGQTPLASPSAQNISPITATTPLPAPQWVTPSAWFIYGAPAALFLGLLLATVKTISTLHDTKWSLADALSEEAELSAPTSGAGPALPAATSPAVALPATNTLPMVTALHASTSRLIAFMGSLALLFIFIGFGTVALYSFAATGAIPPTLKDVTDYLLAGLTLFAPYTVNKFAKLFESLAPKK